MQDVIIFAVVWVCYSICVAAVIKNILHVTS
jgi:hypothetical protein